MAVRGDKLLLANLRRLGARSASQQLDEIAISSLEILRQQTAALAPRPSLKAGVITRKISGTGRRRLYWVGFKRGLAMRIAHLVELGTAPHSLARGASRRYGIMQDVPPFHPGTAAEPFFRPAFEQKKGEVLREYGRRFFQMVTQGIGGRR